MNYRRRSYEVRAAELTPDDSDVEACRLLCGAASVPERTERGVVFQFEDGVRIFCTYGEWHVRDHVAGCRWLSASEFRHVYEVAP